MASASIDEGRFRRWLRTTPHPVKLRLELAGERPPIVLTLSRTNPNKFSEAERSVASMGADVLRAHALDNSGDTIRVYALREEVTEAAPVQKEPWPQSQDAQMAMIITASNDRAAARHENAWKYAFDKLQAMYEAVVAQLQNEQRRTSQLEAALQKELARKEVAIPETEDGLDGLINSLLPALMPKLLAAGEEKTKGANGAPKGA
jgi:hypothetical protein